MPPHFVHLISIVPRGADFGMRKMLWHEPHEYTRWVFLHLILMNQYLKKRFAGLAIFSYT